MSSEEQFTFDNFGLNLEDEDFCRGYGANTNLNEDDYFQNEVNEELLDKAPEMSQDFYQHIDDFLSRGPPKFGDTSKNCGSGSKIKAKPKVFSTTDAPMFPAIKTSDIKHAENASRGPPNPPQEKIKVKKQSGGNKGKQGSRAFIDSNLLNEAFAYTDRLLREAVIEESQQQSQARQNVNKTDSTLTTNSKQFHNRDLAFSNTLMSDRHASHQQLPRSAPLESAYLAGSGNSNSKSRSKGEGGSGNMGAIRRLKSNKQNTSSTAGVRGGERQVAPSSEFNVTANAEQDNRRNVVDFDELVANFESGSTLLKLRRELEQSQQSMANSQKVMKNLSKDFFKS